MVHLTVVTVMSAMALATRWAVARLERELIVVFVSSILDGWAGPVVLFYLPPFLVHDKVLFRWNADTRVGVADRSLAEGVTAILPFGRVALVCSCGDGNGTVSSGRGGADTGKGTTQARVAIAHCARCTRLLGGQPARTLDIVEMRQETEPFARIGQAL